MGEKLNWLLTQAMPGSLVLQPWLKAHGISYSLAQKYVQSGWLKKLSAGVYYRRGASEAVKPSWVDAVQAAQTQLSLPVYVAGLSSLRYQGLSHYLALEKEQIWLGVGNKQVLPKWFREFAQQEWHFCSHQKLDSLTEKDVKTITIEGESLKVSGPELAAYEVLHSMGQAISFEHAAELFQGLVHLSPKKVQSLLERSRAVQTNRVFLFLSHYYQHPWAKYLDESSIFLGSGKRQVVEQGRYNERYQITIPLAFHAKD
ncbi:MAG: type IV toxin-antitoxin system AbiEi family antitoxin [Xanthomonadales bacterium]|nr:type IV toxin-antitoxin system AbiEi family antitoxin [Xanthomonadales bacterium]